MRFAGFVGQSYESRSIYADCQRTVNLFPEALESGTGKSPAALYKVPGYNEFCELTSGGAGSVKCIYTINDRLFAIVDAMATAVSGLYEVQSDGTSALIATMTQLTGGNSADFTMCSDGSQLLVGADRAISGTATGLMTCIDLTTFAVTSIAAPECHIVSFHPDGYFLGIDKLTRKLYISALFDATSWDLLDTAVVATDGTVLQMLVDHLEVWIFCDTKTLIYQNTGNADFPFEPVRGATIETGIMGYTACRMDNTVFWLGRDERGHSIVWRANGYTPVRVSNHAVEYMVDNAVADPADGGMWAWTYQEDGHQFYVLEVFQTTNTASFVYDAATNLWHERSRLDGVGAAIPLLMYGHAFVWGKHIIGGANSSDQVLYDMSRAYFDYAGTDICWLRRAPHLSNEMKRNYYHSLMVDFATGIGGGGGPTGVANQTISLRWSDDGGRTWSSYLTATLGAAGAYKTRVRWNRLGMARDRVFEVSGNEAGKICIVDAFLEVTGGDH
jgi:hypothetical protein